MKITYEQIIEQANIIYKNKIEALYKPTHPDLDMNGVELMLEPSLEAILEALIEVINSSK